MGNKIALAMCTTHGPQLHTTAEQWALRLPADKKNMHPYRDGVYSFDDLVRDGRTVWDGVRNNAAALHLKAMQEGDEVLFYHAGNFFSREGIAAGSVTFHPTGTHHGPHPNAAKNAEDKTFTNEIAVMIDTRNPLRPTKDAAAVEFAEYAMSWRLDQKR